MKIRSSGVIKLAFNGKSRSTSLFTYNLQKETQEQLLAKFREKVTDFFSFYSGFKNKTPIKSFEAYSSDFICTTGCKINAIHTKVSVIPVVYSAEEVLRILREEGKRFGIDIVVKLEG